MIQTLRLGKINMKSVYLNLSLTLTSSIPTERLSFYRICLLFVLCVCLRDSWDRVGDIEVLGIQVKGLCEVCEEGGKTNSTLKCYPITYLCFLSPT